VLVQGRAIILSHWTDELPSLHRRPAPPGTPISPQAQAIVDGIRELHAEVRELSQKVTVAEMTVARERQERARAKDQAGWLLRAVPLDDPPAVDDQRSRIRQEKPEATTGPPR
jgi:hypothetical protein